MGTSNQGARDTNSTAKLVDVKASPSTPAQRQPERVEPGASPNAAPPHRSAESVEFKALREPEVLHLIHPAGCLKPRDTHSQALPSQPQKPQCVLFPPWSILPAELEARVHRLWVLPAGKCPSRG